MNSIPRIKNIVLASGSRTTTYADKSLNRVDTFEDINQDIIYWQIAEPIAHDHKVTVYRNPIGLPVKIVVVGFSNGLDRIKIPFKSVTVLEYREVRNV